MLRRAGEGRITAEGERIPVRCEALDLGYIDGMLLLPLIIEHTIGGPPPLCPPLSSRRRGLAVVSTLGC